MKTATTAKRSLKLPGADRECRFLPIADILNRRAIRRGRSIVGALVTF
jgi:hypothetical protein